MQTIQKKTLKKIIKDKHWMKKGATEKLDSIIYNMLEDMSSRIIKYHQIEERRKASPEDIQMAHNQYREAFEADMAGRVINEIIQKLEDIKRRKKAYYE